ncbi:MAG: histidinol dehydrogenase [Pseudobdellovibrionaceae bacterium]
MKYYDLTKSDTFSDFMRDSRAPTAQDDITSHVAAIIKDVRKNGNAALTKYARQFDHVDLASDDFLIDVAAIDENAFALSAQEKEAIRFAHTRLMDYALRTRPAYDTEKAEGSAYVTQKYVPFDRVACYVPCGSSPLVSTVIHTTVFAKAAGVKDVVMVTSPKTDGIFPAMLYAAKIAGVNSILQCGGVYGIAALAYGTETIKKVDMIAGPGNRFVTEAKRQVFGRVAIDMVAGPSEVMVIADESADIRFIAADLLAQAEHGSGYEQAVLVTNCDSIYRGIEQELRAQAADLMENAGLVRVLEHGIFVLKVEHIEEAIALCNAYAPEHVEVQTHHAEKLAEGITSAGAIMIGNWTPEPIGDFVAGSSHVLPTGGGASSFSGLTTAHFLKKISIQKFDKDLLEECRIAAETFAQMEQLPAHGRSVSIRFQD